jgi:hypothetical protein
MVISFALLGIAQNLVRTDDLPESDRSIRIARSDVGVGTFDGCSESGPEIFGVIVRKRSKQIVKRLHHRSRC